MCLHDSGRGFVYIELKPEEPGVKCLRMELSLSPAIVKRSRRLRCEGGEKLLVWEKVGRLLFFMRATELMLSLVWGEAEAWLDLSGVRPENAD